MRTAPPDQGKEQSVGNALRGIPNGPHNGRSAVPYSKIRRKVGSR